MSMDIYYLECYIVPIVAGIVFILFSLFFFSNVPIIDAIIKAVILGAIVFLTCVFILPTEPIIIKLGGI